MQVFKIENLFFKFTSTAPAFFKSVNLSFKEASIHFIRGQNGVGKSTLFRLLQGKVYKQEIATGIYCMGEERYKMSNQNLLPRDFTSHIKLVPQKFDLMIADQFSFEQNLQFANMREFPLFGKLPLYHELPPFVSRFTIDIHKEVRLLSGGQRQILAILMALQKDVSILLLDEPTAALDDQNAKMVMDFLLDLVRNTGITVIIICHDKELVTQYASRGYYEITFNPQTNERSVIFVQNL